jgi:hypothetical protein
VECEVLSGYLHRHNLRTNHGKKGLEMGSVNALGGATKVCRAFSLIRIAARGVDIWAGLHGDVKM